MFLFFRGICYNESMLIINKNKILENRQKEIDARLRHARSFAGIFATKAGHMIKDIAVLREEWDR